MVTSAMKLKDTCSLGKKKKNTHTHTQEKPRQDIKKQKHYFAYKGPYSQSYGFFQ